MSLAVHIETLAETFLSSLTPDHEWLRRVFVLGMLDDDYEDAIAQLALKAQGKLKRDIVFYGGDTPFPRDKLVLINDFDIILDLQLVQALASNGNVVLCKFKASSVVSVLHGVSGDLSRLSNQRNLLSYIRFVATYHRPEDTGAGHEVFYTTYLRFSQAIQDQLTATARHHWRSRLRPHLSLEARSSLGTMIINKGMRFGDPVLGLAIANDDHWDA